MYNGIHVKYPLLLYDFIFSDKFSKTPQISNFMKIRPVGADLFHTVGHDEAGCRFS